MKSIVNFFKNNKVIKFIYGLFKFLIFTVLIVYVAFVLYQRFTDNASLFGYRVFTVASGSMTPAYNVNDVIYIKEVDPGTLKVGDDIAYQGEMGSFKGLIITHRIIDIEEESDGSLRIFTQGINNENEDPSINEDQILGKVYGKVFFISELNHVVKSTWGFFLLIFVPLTLVIVLEILETIVEYRLDNNKIRKYGTDDDDEDEEEYEYVEDDDDDESSLEDDILNTIEMNVLEEPSIIEEGEEDDEEII